MTCRGQPAPGEAVATFLYVRFHGTSGKYAGGYSSQRLGDWARWLRLQQKPAFVYFNNDVAGQAPKDASKLRTLLSRPHERPISGP